MAAEAEAAREARAKASHHHHRNADRPTHTHTHAHTETEIISKLKLKLIGEVGALSWRGNQFSYKLSATIMPIYLFFLHNIPIDTSYI